MSTEAAHATSELISICQDHQQHEVSASLALVLIAARRAHALLATCWRELGNQALIEEELRAIDSHLYRIIDVLERMEEDEPGRSYRGELERDSSQLHAINEALRELIEHRAVIRDLPALLASVIAAAAVLHVLRMIAGRREDALRPWPELAALRLTGEVHLEKITELALAELRTISDARFAAKRWRGQRDDSPTYGYVFEERRYTPPPAALADGADAHQLSREAMAEHQECAFAGFPGVVEIHLLLEQLGRIKPGRRAAA
jgi:hypothetical protein